LLQPADHWYKDFALECSKRQISVDMFVFSGQYTDVATICMKFLDNNNNNL